MNLDDERKGIIMTAEQKQKREMAVDNLYYLYKKYYPQWVEMKKAEAADKKAASVAFWGFHFFPTRVII